MKLVLDTNILISALIKDSLTRSILVSPYFEFYMPEHGITELEKYKDLLKKKSGLNTKKLDRVLEHLIENIRVVPAEEFVKHLGDARKLLKEIDPDDAPFLALAMAIENEGLWSRDKKLKEQNKVRIWSTLELKEKLDELVKDI